MNGKQAAAIALTLIIAIPILAGYAFASESVTKTQTVTESTTSLSDILLNSTTAYYNDYNGPENNSLMVEGDGSGAYSFVAPAYVSTGSSQTSIPLGAADTASFALTPGVYVSLSSFAYSSWSFSTLALTHIRLTYSDGSTEILHYAAGDFLKSGSTFIAKEGGYQPSYHYTLVSDVAVQVDNTNSITLNYYLPGSTTYADPSYGWSIPDSNHIYSWINGYSNKSVTFYMHMDTGAATKTATFSPYLGTYTGDTDIDIMLSSAGVITVKPDYSSTTYTLGSYNDVQIIYDLDAGKCTVSGIAAWPSMDGSPTTYNSVSFDTANLYSDTFPLIAIAGDTSAVWRCDAAEIVAGTFPVTENYTLNMGGLFPGKEYNVKLNSIGIYGDILTIAGTSYAVTDGTITVNNESVKLKGMEIEVVEDSGTWTTSVNGDQVASGSSAPTFVFGGVWSLTATADILTDETVTVDEWKPGAFAFDKDNFILMLLLCSVAVFVALGFTAGRSGGKVLALIVSCGGAAVIALMMV